jgi:hypothetical protein
MGKPASGNDNAPARQRDDATTDAEERLDEALSETFPASDPIAVDVTQDVHRVTRGKQTP